MPKPPFPTPPISPLVQVLSEKPHNEYARLATYVKQWAQFVWRCLSERSEADHIMYHVVMPAIREQTGHGRTHMFIEELEDLLQWGERYTWYLSLLDFLLMRYDDVEVLASPTLAHFQSPRARYPNFDGSRMAASWAPNGVFNGRPEGA